MATTKRQPAGGKKRQPPKPVKHTTEPDGTVKAWYRISDLILDPTNARKHGDRDLTETGDSIEQFRQVKNIVIDADGVVRAGNGTCLALLRRNEELVWGARADHLSDDVGMAYGVKDNRTSELSSWNFEQLADNLKGLEARGLIDIKTLGFADYELDPLMQAAWMPPAVEDLPAPATPAERIEPVELTAKERKLIERAVKAMRRHLGDEATEGAVLAAICNEWLKGYGNAGG